MKKHLAILIILILSTFSSCTKDKDILNYTHSSYISIQVKNLAGEDLLNAEHPNTVVKDGEIKVYVCLKNNRELLAEQTKYYANKSYEIRKTDNGGYYILLSLLAVDKYNNSDFYRTIVEWSNGDRDVFDVTFAVVEGVFCPQTVVLNGVSQKPLDGVYPPVFVLDLVK